MYRLVVVLMILSLSGSEAASSSESDGNLSDEVFHYMEEPVESNRPVRWADYKLRKAILYFRRDAFINSDFEAAEKLADLLEPPKGEMGEISHSMRRIISDFAELGSIYEGMESGINICSQEEIDKLKNLQINLNYGDQEGSDEIYRDIDLYIVRRVLRFSQRFFKYCMTKLTNDFDSVSEDSELKGAIKRMREFEIFIDKEKEAQREEFPFYCNEEIQVINLENSRRLVNIILIKGGMKPVYTEGNELPPDAMKEVGKFFASTCLHEKFAPVRYAMEFIMEAKRSFWFKRGMGLNSGFDCGKNMGRFQLCEEARKLISAR